MSKYLYLLVLLFSACILSACPAPRYDFVIINRSNETIEIEYEFILYDMEHDYWREKSPAKMITSEYEKNDNKNWEILEIGKDFLSENEKLPNPQQSETSSNEIFLNKVKLQLKPNEVLRVLNSDVVNSDIRGVKKLNIKSKSGSLIIEGDGFRQFYRYKKGGLFSGRTDYRLVYGGISID